MLRVLVVDDDVELLEAVKVYLEMEGFSPTATSNPKRAFQMAQELKPQVIILDILMPGMNGYEICRKIRATNWGSNVRILAFTALTDTVHEPMAKAAGFDMQITKPVPLSTLAQIIRKVTLH
jgi:two-component system, OmpR family, response regulator MtrA